MPQLYSIDQRASLKILLHSAAHPAYSVNGLLIGKILDKAAAQNAQEEPGSPRQGRERISAEILDAIPLFHTSLSLAPMTETALIQADAFARSRGLQLVGYYQANENIDNLELGPAGRKIAERIQSHTPQACALLVDNSKLQGFLQQKEETFLQLHIKEGNKSWAQLSSSHLRGIAENIPQQFLTGHAEGRHHKLVDFDDHLNDIRKDWLNLELL